MCEELEPNDQQLPSIETSTTHNFTDVSYPLTTTDVRTDDGQYVVLGELDSRNQAAQNGNADFLNISVFDVSDATAAGFGSSSYESDQFLDDEMSDVYSSYSGDGWTNSVSEPETNASVSQYTNIELSPATMVSNVPMNGLVSDQELDDVESGNDSDLYTTRLSESEFTNQTSFRPEVVISSSDDYVAPASDQYSPEMTQSADRYGFDTNAVYYHEGGQYKTDSYESSSDSTLISFVKDDDTANAVFVVNQDNSVTITVNEHNGNSGVDPQFSQPLLPQNTHTGNPDESNIIRPTSSEPDFTPDKEPTTVPPPRQDSSFDTIIDWFEDMWTSFAEYIEDVWNDWSTPIDSEGTGPYPTFTGPDSDAIAGEPTEAMDHWELQNRPDTCAVVAQMMVVEELTGKNLSQDDVVRIAENAGVYVEGMGTPQELLGEVIEAYGLETETINDASVSDIESHLNKGEKMIVAVRADDYWNPEAGSMDEQLYKSLGLPDPGANHCVQVIGIDRSDPKHPQVIVNDPGHPDGRGMTIPMDQFEDAWANSGNLLVTAHA